MDGRGKIQIAKHNILEDSAPLGYNTAPLHK
jgi:hypothetical protein